MVKTVKRISLLGIVASVVIALVGVFISIHMFLTAIVGLCVATGMHGTASRYHQR